MAFETPNDIDQGNRKEHQPHTDGGYALQNEPNITDEPADTQGVITPLVDEALDAVRAQSDADEQYAYSGHEVAAMKSEIETIRDSVSSLTSASSRVVKAEANDMAATFNAHLRAQPVVYLGLGALLGYILGRRV